MFNSGFTFDGFSSVELNLHIVSMSVDTFSSVLASRGQENLTFEVEIAYADEIGNAKVIDTLERRIVYSSLVKEDYKELILEDYPDIVFYAKFVPVDVNLNHKEYGYFKFRIETNSKDAYSPYREYEFINEKDVEDRVLFSSFDNLNIDPIFPILEFEIIDDTVEEVYIKTSDKAIHFDFSDLKDYEKLVLYERIVVDCETHTITQSNENEFCNRVKQWNCFFAKINNMDYLSISPRTKIKIKYRMKILM